MSTWPQTRSKYSLLKIGTKGSWTLTLCLTTAASMTVGNFLQTCIKNSLLPTKIN